MTNRSRFTSIRLTSATAGKLRNLVARMREEDPTVRSADDVVAQLIDMAQLIDRQDLEAGLLDSTLRRWQNRLSDDVSRTLLNAHAEIGKHVVRATTQLRQGLQKQPEKVLGDAADEVVLAADQSLGVPVKDMRGTLPQADVCFYIGDRAEGWYAARKRGVKAAEEFEKETSPDLVVEIEADDADAPGFDARPNIAEITRARAMQGFREMWYVTTRPGEGQADIRIFDLKDPDRRAVRESTVLTGLTATVLPEAFHLAAQGRLEQLQKFLEEVCE